MKRISVKYLVLGAAVLAVATLGLGAAWGSSGIGSVATTSSEGFLFAVDSFSVKGNLDYTDNFDDGSRSDFPSSRLIDAPAHPMELSVGKTRTAETGGYLLLEGGREASAAMSSADADLTSVASEKFVRGELAGIVRDTVVLDQAISDGGAGQTVITASFAAAVPVRSNTCSAGYGMFVAGANEATGAFAGSYVKAAAVDANTVALAFVDQDSKVLDRVVISDFYETVGESLVIRLTVDHLKDTVAPTYSLDGGATFSKFPEGAKNSVYTEAVGDKLYAGVLGEGPAPEPSPASPAASLALLASGLLIGTATVFVMFRVR